MKLLICTVGRSSLSNNEHRNIENVEQLYRVLRENEHEGNYKALGAEIYSIRSMAERNYFNPNENGNRIVFLCSDTEEGNLVGDALVRYYGNQIARKVIVQGLRPECRMFNSVGLKNLIEKIAEIKKDQPEYELLINATGGYKAQILFAGVIGQVLNIPVYYQNERFDEIIRLLPLPVEFDYSFWLRNFSVFKDIEDEGAVNVSKYPVLAQWPSVLLEYETRGDEQFATLSSLGQLFNKGFYNRFYDPALRGRHLPPRRPETMQPDFHFEDQNENRVPGLKTVFQKIWDFCPYVKRLQTTRYFGEPVQKARFVKTEETNAIKGKMCQSGRGSVEFLIYITPCTDTQRDAAIVDLTMKFENTNI